MFLRRSLPTFSLIFCKFCVSVMYECYEDFQIHKGKLSCSFVLTGEYIDVIGYVNISYLKNNLIPPLCESFVTVRFYVDPTRVVSILFRYLSLQFRNSINPNHLGMFYRNFVESVMLKP